MKNQLLDLSFHIRHKNKKIQEITNQTRREIRAETNPTRAHKAHLRMLMSVMNNLPDEEQASYPTFKSILFSDSLGPKENTPNTLATPVTRMRSLPHKLAPSITEIPYKNCIDVQEYQYNLYVSDAKTANDLAELQKYHIHALLTFGQGNDPSKYTFLKGGYLCLPLEETSGSLINIMDKVSRFIDTYISKGNILVHCCE